MANKLLKTSMWVTIIMMVSYVLSFAKESVVAYYFGVGEATDAYTIAIQIPVLLFSCISVAIQSVVVPLYSDLYYQKGKQNTSNFIHKLITILLIISVSVVFLGEIFSSGIIYIFAPGFNDSTHKLATLLLRIVWPSIIFSILSQVYTAILNVHKKFIGPAFAVYFLNGFLIACIVLLYTKMGIIGACIGQIVGGFANYFYLKLLIGKIYSYHVDVDLKDETIHKSLKMTVPILWSISVAEVNAMVNRAVASFLFVGSVASLSYASKVNGIFSTFFLSAITSIIYPLYAESASKNDMEQLNSRVNLTLSVILYLMLPLVAFVIVYNEDIIRIAFARGAFDDSAVEMTSVLLCCYAIGLPFIAFRTNITKIFYSLKDTRTPAINATLGIILNLILNISLPFVIGLKGLALATSITACFISMRLLYQLIRKHKALHLTEMMSNAKKIVFVSAILLVILVLSLNITKGLSLYIHFGLGAIITGICYLVASVLFNIPIFKTLLNHIKK